MTKKIPIGVDNFSKLADKDRNFLFVDKSLMVKDLIDKGSEVSLIIRPRRWGKTLNMSMLQHFFAPEVNDRSTKGIFDDLKIAKESDGDYLNYQGNTPVIFISFKDIKQDSWKVFFEKIVDLISSSYREHEKTIIESDKLTETQKKLYKKILNSEGNQGQLENSLKFLSECLYHHYEKKIIVLIDEYDTPLNAAYNKEHFEQVVNFFKGMFGAALKGNNALEKGVMTGILRLSKNKMLSDINNLSLYSLMEKQYSNYFGFSEKEVIDLFEAKGLDFDIREIRRWYNGYRAGDLTTIYNPWSVLNCIQSEGELKPYWIKTGDEGLLKEIFSRSDKGVEDKLIELLEDKSIESVVDEYISFDQINEGGSDVLWSLLWATGYLKFSEQPTISETGNYTGFLAIPNYEVSCSYRAVFPKWIRSFNRVKYDSFLKNLVLGKINEFAKDLEDYMLTIPSYFDFPRESNYHTFLLGLTASLKETHDLHSNKETGYGRMDMLLIPKNTSNNLGIILEFKREKSKQDLGVYYEAATEGIEQIEIKKYDSVLKSISHIKQILKLCIVFYGKQFIHKSSFEDL
jgi:hypothetical protein